MEIILATNNPGKLLEMQKALMNSAQTEKESVTLLPYTKFATVIEKPVESGQTYQENAFIKAKFYAEKLQRPVLGDDGGLELAAFPDVLGVQTSRFFKTSDPLSQNQEILALYANQTLDRTIHLTTTLVYYVSATQILRTSATLTGQLVEPQGSQGYGFDSIFLVPELKKTLAQLSQIERDQLSPRIRALQLMIQKIQEANDA